MVRTKMMKWHLKNKMSTNYEADWSR